MKPGTEDIVGDSKFFIGKWSTFYNFHLGSYTILNGSPVSNNQVQGYECTTVGTQNMPPSWTMNTDPNVDWDTQGRAYMTTLPFNAFWEGGLHPNGEIDVSYSDDMGAHWVKGNGGKALDSTNNQTSLTLGHVEDKEWIAVNHIVGNANQDHVYAMWTTFNGASGGSKIMVAVSRDRGQTFSKAGPADDAFGDDAGEHLRLSVGRCGRHGLRRLRQRVRHDEQESGRPCLRDEVSRRRQYVDAVHASRRPRSRTRTATSRRRSSGTGSSRTSRPARPTRGMST